MNTLVKSLTIAVAVGGLALAGTALAQGYGAGSGQRGMQGGPRMGSAPGPGYCMTVDADTAAAIRAERFTALDADKDGKVTLAEFKANHRGRQQLYADEAFARLDADGDGALSQEELTTAHEPLQMRGGR